MFCFIDYRTSLTEKLNLSKLHLEPIEIPKCNLLYEAIDGHVDIQIHILDKIQKKIMCHPNIDITFLKEIKNKNISFIYSEKRLSLNYPNNIFLNAFSTNNAFIHNIKYTDKILLQYNQGKNIIHVKQGYTKCSILPINENAIITNDIGIYNSLINRGFDILLLPPGDIMLPPLNHGFIGGVGGMISLNKMVFFGSLENYKYGDQLKKFLYKYDVEPIYLDNTKLKDRGSLLTF